jgi:EmrB/QacA subfamily drug resistance transporter
VGSRSGPPITHRLAVTAGLSRSAPVFLTSGLWRPETGGPLKHKTQNISVRIVKEINFVETISPKLYRQRWIGLTFLGVALLIISIDNTVLNVALPSIANQLGASTRGLQWIVDAYTLVFAALLLTSGSIGDRTGRKRALQIGQLVFGVGSLACALATSEGMLIGFRAFLGIGGAIIMPSTLSIITATFKEPKERALAIGIWAGVFGLGSGVGPVIAGGLLEHFSWSSVFYINLPVVVIGLIGVQFFVAESRDEHAPQSDIPGLLMSIVGLFALVYGIIQAGSGSWSDAAVVWSLGIAAVVLLLFVWWEGHSRHAMMPLKLFKNMSFSGANIALAMVMFAMFGSLFFMGQFFQSVQGYSPLQAGLRLLPMAPILMVVAVSSARISRSIGIKLSVGSGILIAAGGLLFVARTVQVDTPYWMLLIAMAILCSGMALAMSPATNSIMGSVPVRQAGVASAMNNTLRQVGGALGVAVLGTLMSNTYVSQVNTALAARHLNNLPSQALNSIGSGIQAAHIVAAKIPDPAISKTINDLTNSAFVSGMRGALLVGTIIMITAGVITLVILPSKIRPPTEEEASVSPEK